MYVMRLPDWIKEETRKNRGCHDTRKILRGMKLSTVCEEARCPNQGQCFERATATFLILGDTCTRGCGFCAVKHGTPGAPEADEPARVAEACLEMGLKYVVVTSVTRDDLVDGGAMQFAKTIEAIRAAIPEAKVEVLTPDFGGDEAALKIVLDARPDVFNHNVETVPRLYPEVRSRAVYRRSLDLLATVKRISPETVTKSGIMVGLGETFDEVTDVFTDLREAGCDLLTVGQYLRPRRTNLPVKEYVEPEIFGMYRARAMAMGFRNVASAPLARSSMKAEEMIHA
ncbi:MAG: lipoyl synthase [Nitrospirae bacterium]|nr:lipoyl synthase [Nitrospirota bacterium]